MSDSTPVTQMAALALAAVLVLGLILVGQDGAVATYAGLVLASALVVWWTGWH